jgi:uncharacterized protein YjiS (DUF1127 family)
MTTNPALSQQHVFLVVNQVPSLRRKLVERIREWRRRARSRNDLMALGQRELLDLCLSRTDAAHEASKPFWKE